MACGGDAWKTPLIFPERVDSLPGPVREGRESAQEGFLLVPGQTQLRLSSRVAGRQ